MSQLLAPTHTYADSIPLGRRITEIMAEKGPAYTIAAMAKRLEINRETLRLMLKGEREIYTFELERIAQDLKVPVERILQSDTVEESRQLKEMLQTSDDHERGLVLAKSITERAIGLTERVIAENDHIFVYYRLRKYEMTTQLWTRLLPEAESINEKYGEPTIFLWVTSNLLNSKTSMHDYSNLENLIAKAEPYFHTNPRTAGVLCHTIARIREKEYGDPESAREKYDQMLEYYKLYGNPVNLARAQSTVANFEYNNRNYQRAYDLQEEIFRTFQLNEDLHYRLIMSRDRAKILIRWNRIPEAIQLLHEILERIDWTQVTCTDYAAEYYLLLMIATKNPTYAEQVICKNIGSYHIQKLAAKFLVVHYQQVRDHLAMSKWAGIAKQLRSTPLDLLLEELSMNKLTLLALLDFCQSLRWHVTE